MLWMADHLALRLDYRVLFVDGPAISSISPGIRRPQRFSAGVYVAF
jgi:hypothetical protein